MTKTPTLTETSKPNEQHKNATKTFDNTKIADRLRTVSRSSNIHPIGVVKQDLKSTNLPTHRKRNEINLSTWQDGNIVENSNRLSQRWIHFKS